MSTATGPSTSATADHLTIDFETYTDTHFTVRKLPTLVYIRDPRFLVHGAAVKWNSTAARFLEGAKLRDYLAEIDWSKTATITFNANFDNTILHEHYAVTPAYRYDVLAMARALAPRDIDLDLDTLCALLGVPGKHGGGKILEQIKGKRELEEDERQALATYAIGDAESTYALFNELVTQMPATELEVQDLVIAMSTEGKLVLDPAMLEAAEKEIVDERQAHLERCDVTAEVLRSRDKFAALLKEHGVEPPTKISRTTGKTTWAFSRSDPDFIKLQTDPKAADLVRARLAWASNNAISRIRHFKTLASCAPRTLPVQLNANGTHTHRFSGGGRINAQNLNRGSKLRLSITAPKDHVIVVVDSSQIELRLNAWFSDQDDLLEALRQGRDPYKIEAARQFRIPEDQVTAAQRLYAKVVTLACGYGLGPPTFQIFCACGPYGNPPIHISFDEAVQTIRTYRNNNAKIKENWGWLEQSGLPAMFYRERELVKKCLTFAREEIVLPSGLSIKYHGLECREEGWFYGLNGREHVLHAGIVANNTTQALAGEVIRLKMRETHRELGGVARIVHQVHDELLLLCRERDADEVLAEATRIMSSPVGFAPNLPLACKGGYDWRYSK